MCVADLGLSIIVCGYVFCLGVHTCVIFPYLCVGVVPVCMCKCIRVHVCACVLSWACVCV